MRGPLHPLQAPGMVPPTHATDGGPACSTRTRGTLRPAPSPAGRWTIDGAVRLALPVAVEVRAEQFTVARRSSGRQVGSCICCGF